ncbi:MAG TPA: hypothetical protein VJB99_02250, partial [Patescibacteria group bacterium]|nr:hypothetical protein [Patescibacteria group bacterium]
LIATDEDPELTETVRQFSEKLHEDVQLSLRTADELEAAMDQQVSSTPVVHFHPQYGTMEETVRRYGIAIPAAMQGKVGGVSGVQSGTLMPGSKALVVLSIGPSGGKRYNFHEVSENGLTRLKEECERPYTRKDVLAIVDAPDWHSAWTESKDSEITSYVLANAGGIHRYYRPIEEYDGYGARTYINISTTAWSGLNPVTPSEEEICRVFGLEMFPVVTNPVRKQVAKPVPEPEPIVTTPAEPQKPLSREEVLRELKGLGGNGFRIR